MRTPEPPPDVEAADDPPYLRLYDRLPPGTKPGDIVDLRDGRRAVVETAKLAEDLRDTKCAVLAEPVTGAWPPGWRPRMYWESGDG